MAYNEELAKRIRLALKLFPRSIFRDFQEKKMFGGLAFLYLGKMTVGIIKNDLMVIFFGKDGFDYINSIDKIEYEKHKCGNEIRRF